MQGSRGDRAAVTIPASPRRKPIRIAFVHSFYRSENPSGENRTVEAEVRALRIAGHQVQLVAARTDELEQGRLFGTRSAIRVATGLGRSPLSALAEFEPQVVHVHNLFPNWNRRWPRSLDRPLVVTLHNFRPLCANGALFRQGNVCTRCPDEHTTLPAIRYACYRGSRPATVPLAIADRNGIQGHPVITRAAKVIVLSEIARAVYERAGVDRSRLVTWSNFLSDRDDPGHIANPAGGRHWLYVGRLGPEKGIARLVRLWPRDRPLVIAGDGPDRAAVADAAAGKNVELLGLQPASRVPQLMRGAVGLVFPSVCYENFPLVFAESMAVGLPVLAWEPTTVSSLVRATRTGIVTTWAEDISPVLDRAEEAFPALASSCRELFVRDFSEHAYVRRAEALYRELVSPPRLMAGRSADGQMGS